MCKQNEQTKREKSNVEPPSRERVVPPGQSGTGILND